MTLLAALVPLSAAAEGLPSFSFTGASALRRAAAEAAGVPSPSARAADVITQPYLHAQAGRDALLGSADTAAQAAEASAQWAGTLRAAGVTPGTPRFEAGLWILPYTAPAGLALREFTADPKQFPPKDEAGLRANMALAQQALSSAGLSVVSAKVLELGFVLPTYTLLYLTPAAADDAHETRLRLLNAREESDFSVFAGAVRVVQVPKPWLMVYVGPQAGVVHMGAADAAAAQRKLAERRAFLTGEGHRILSERVTPTGDAVVPFEVSLYFLY
jgi:hypothetical protein